MGIPPAGYKPYPGGHLLAYDLKTGKFEDFGIAPRPRRRAHVQHGHRSAAGCSASPGPAASSSATTWRRRTRRDFGNMCAEGEDGSRRRLPHRLPLHRRGPGRRLGLLHHLRRHDPPLSTPTTDSRRARRRRGHEEGLLRPLRSDLARPHGLQLAADLLAPEGQDDLRRPRQLRLPVPLRPARAAHRGAGPHHVRAVQALRHVRPVQLRLPRLRPGPGRQDHPLPDRRPDLHGRQAPAGKSNTAMGEAKGWRTCTWSPTTSPPANTPTTARSSTRTASAPLRQLHRRRQGRHGLYPAAHHRERPDPLRPGQRDAPSPPGHAARP